MAAALPHSLSPTWTAARVWTLAVRGRIAAQRSKRLLNASSTGASSISNGTSN